MKIKHQGYVDWGNHPNGPAAGNIKSAHIDVDWDDQFLEIFIERDTPTRKHMAIFLDRNAARSLMESLNQHFAK